MTPPTKLDFRRKLPLVGALLIPPALLAAGCGSGAPAAGGAEPGEASFTISGGIADQQHESVFLLVSHQNESGSLCTATLIAPNLLLTARHCVSPGTGDRVTCGESVLGEPYAASSFFTTNDPTPNDDSPFFRATEVHVPSQGTDTCGYDVALVILDSVVPGSIAVPSVPRIDQEVMPGENYTAVGYGEDANGQQTLGRMRREGLNVVCQPGSCGSGVESTEFRGEDGICSGDSGGPAIDEDGKVVGVVSRGGADCGTPVYGTVTAWKDFIIGVARKAAELGDYQAPFWVTTGLSDPPAVTNPDPSGAPLPRAAEGASCSSSSSCDAGLVCYSPSGEPAEASCTRTCTSSADCASGQACESAGSVSVCRAPRAADDGGCALVGVSGSGLGGGGSMLAALAMLGARRRRRA
jgi:hypothetical protein